MVRAGAQERGINFETALTLQQAREKANKEHKYIFIDCYATWCGPCKLMDRGVFPIDSVGDFMNQNFISVREQMDSTGRDNSDIVKKYADVKYLNSHYKITAYPTFLFLTAEGKLIGRSTGAVNKNKFIDIATNAKQYERNVELFKEGKRDSLFLKQLIFSALTTGDSIIYTDAGKDFLQQLKNPFLKQNLRVITSVTKSSKGPEFAFFIKNRDKIDQIMQLKSYTTRVIGSVIFREEIAPALEKAESWEEIKSRINRKYPEYGDKEVTLREIVDDMHKQNWPDFNDNIRYFMGKYYAEWSDDADFLNTVAYRVFLHSDDNSLLESALKWSDKALQIEQAYEFMDTYANLLYKLGRKDEAITWEQKAVEKGTKDEEVKATLEKMKNGQKTW